MIPAAIWKAAHLLEGDPVEVTMTPAGILPRPRKVVELDTVAGFRVESP